MPASYRAQHSLRQPGPITPSVHSAAVEKPRFTPGSLSGGHSDARAKEDPFEML